MEDVGIEGLRERRIDELVRARSVAGSRGPSGRARPSARILSIDQRPVLTEDPERGPAASSAE